MAGLLSIALLSGWSFLAFLIARQVTSGLKSSLARFGLMIPLFAVLVVLPVADELIGGFQFRALCKENAVLKIDAQKIKGKTIREVPVPLIGTQDMTQTAVRIYFYRIGYRDSVSGEEFASYVSYTAMGGLLVSALGMSNDIAPLTIHPSSCKPRNVGDLSKEFDFKFTPNRK